VEQEQEQEAFTIRGADYTEVVDDIEVSVAAISTIANKDEEELAVIEIAVAIKAVVAILVEPLVGPLVEVIFFEPSIRST